MTTARFPKGEPADPTEHMDDAAKARWEEAHDMHKDKFKNAADLDADLASLRMASRGPDRNGRDWKQRGDRWLWDSPQDGASFSIRPVGSGLYSLTLLWDGDVYTWKGNMNSPEAWFEMVHRMWPKLTNSIDTGTFLTKNWNKLGNVDSDLSALRKMAGVSDLDADLAFLQRVAGDLVVKTAAKLDKAVQRLDKALSQRGVKSKHLSPNRNETPEGAVVSYWIPGDEAEMAGLLNNELPSATLTQAIGGVGFRPLGHNAYQRENLVLDVIVRRGDLMIEVRDPEGGVRSAADRSTLPGDEERDLKTFEGEGFDAGTGTIRREAAVKPGQKFVIVDVTGRDPKWVDNEIYDGTRKADREADKYRKQQPQAAKERYPHDQGIQVIDAVWFGPAEQKLKALGMRSAAKGLQVGDAATWNGKKVLVVDVHGYPPKTVDLRWTESGTSGSKDEVSGHKRNVPVSQIKTAARAPSGLYGYTRRVQGDCEVANRRVSKAALGFARTAYGRDERVASFLQTHAKRANSVPAKILLAALQNLGPKVASQGKTAGSAVRWNLKRAMDDKEWGDFIKAVKGIFGAASRLRKIKDQWEPYVSLGWGPYVAENGLQLTGPGGSGSPIVTGSQVAFNGPSDFAIVIHPPLDFENREKAGLEDFNFHKAPHSDSCKTNDKPYGLVAISVLAVAKKIMGKDIEVRGFGGGPVKKVLGKEVKLPHVKPTDWFVATNDGDLYGPYKSQRDARNAGADLQRWDDYVETTAIDGKEAVQESFVSPIEAFTVRDLEKRVRDAKKEYDRHDSNPQNFGLYAAASPYVGYIEDGDGFIIRFFGAGPKSTVSRDLSQAAGILDRDDVEYETTLAPIGGGEWAGTLRGRTIQDRWFSRLPRQDKARLQVVLDAQQSRGASKEAAARKYGLYGYPAKVASLGLTSCTALREEVGRIAVNLHRRRAAQHAHITGFLKNHGKEAKCLHSRMLLSCYPSEDVKLASLPTPHGVEAWLSWED